MKKADNFDAKQWLVENKITTQSNKLINEAFEDLLQQLSAMAEKGEIDNNQIKSIENTLMSARRQGQSAARKNSPDYAEKVAAAKEKAALTRAKNKKEDEENAARWKAEREAKQKEEQERRASGKLPLTISKYWYGYKTEGYLGDLAQYYREVTPMQGPGSDGTSNLVLKPVFQDQSFDNAQVAWDVYDRKVNK